MVTAKKQYCLLIIGITFALIASLNLCSSVKSGADAESYSFVYSYGNAKVWVFLTLNRTFLIGPEANASISFTLYLEKLGSNRGVFVNRLTFGFEGTQIREIVSPNVTLDNNLRSWAGNVTFEEGDVDQVLMPGQTLARALNFEFRYDVMDSSGEYWPYRVSENIPATIQMSGQAGETWITFGTVFLLISLLGVAFAVVVLGLRIRRYKRATLSAKEKKDELT